VTIHKSWVQTINYCENKLITGGADCVINVLNPETLAVISCINCVSTPRAIDLKDGKLLVGFRNGSIVEYPNTTAMQGKVLMNSHCNGEVWGLDLLDNVVMTSADDNRVCLWNT